ncbi:MAG: hypothetical protein JEZ05_10065 [Tenericutes bacterium]|nr:hypothetical protein [Mycoplasmatota bacterium]
MASRKVINKWRVDFENYTQPSKRNVVEEGYLNQLIEMDAINFASKSIDRLLKS